MTKIESKIKRLQKQKEKTDSKTAKQDLDKAIKRLQNKLITS